MKCASVLKVPSGHLGRNLPLCVAIAWINGAIGVVIPTIMPFWIAQGLSFREIWVLQGVFALTLATCTIPFGYLADARGRKGCLTVGVSLSFFGEVSYLMGDTFAAFLIAEVCMGVGCALVSGADSALLYDTLKARGDEEANKRWAGLAAAGCFFVTALGNIASGYVVMLGERVPFMVSSAFVALQLALVLLVVEPNVDRDRRLVSVRQLPKVFGFCLQLGSPQLWLIAAWSVVTVATWLAMWFYPICFKTAGLSVAQQGLVFAFYNVVAGAASLAARRQHEGVSVPAAFVVFVLLAAAAHLLFGVVVAVWAFLFGAMHQIVRGAAPVVFGHALHSRTPSEIRATVLSIEGAIATLLYGAINLRLGACIEAFGFQFVLVAISGGCVVAASLIWFVRPAEHQ